jgi:hypothetical protein
MPTENIRYPIFSDTRQYGKDSHIRIEFDPTDPEAISKYVQEIATAQQLTETEAVLMESQLRRITRIKEPEAGFNDLIG